MRFRVFGGLSLAMLFFSASVAALAADDDGVLRPEFAASSAIR